MIRRCHIIHAYQFQSKSFNRPYLPFLETFNISYFDYLKRNAKLANISISKKFCKLIVTFIFVEASELNFYMTINLFNHFCIFEGNGKVFQKQNNLTHVQDVFFLN